MSAEGNPAPNALKRAIHPLRLYWRARRRDLADLVARVNEEPVIVLGHQKAGTSIIAALLGEISGRSVAIDLMREVTEPTFHEVEEGRLSLDRFIAGNRLEFSRDIVKESNLTPMYPALRVRFPKARFAFVVRDPRTNIRSILQRLGLSGRPDEVGASEIAQVTEAWRLVLDGRWLGLEGDDHLSMLAARWQRFAEIAEANRDDMVVLRYEDFLADKADSIRHLALGLGIEARHDISDKTEIQYQPRGDHSRSLEDFFGEEALREIERICAPGMAHFGYD